MLERFFDLLPQLKDGKWLTCCPKFFNSNHTWILISHCWNPSTLLLLCFICRCVAQFSRVTCFRSNFLSFLTSIYVCRRSNDPLWFVWTDPLNIISARMQYLYQPLGFWIKCLIVKFMTIWTKGFDCRKRNIFACWIYSSLSGFTYLLLLTVPFYIFRPILWFSPNISPNSYSCELIFNSKCFAPLKDENLVHH